jgi:putative intracellular protease/amidase
MNMRFLAIVTDGFEDLEAIGSIALLRRAGIEVDLAGALDQPYVKGSHRTVVKTDVSLGAADLFVYDGLLLPGGGHVRALAEMPHVLETIRRFADAGKWLTAICAAPSLLGMLGLLDGKRYISFPGTETHMPKGIRILKAAVTDGKIVTGAGAGATIEFALEIIRAVLGEETAQTIMKRTIYRAYE